MAGAVDLRFNVSAGGNAEKKLIGIGNAAEQAHSRTKALIAGFAGGLVGAKAVDFLRDSVNQASGLNEAGTKMQAIFGTATDQVVKFAEGGAKALGQNKLAVEDAAASFGTFGKAAGLSGKDLAKFATGFTGLSTDLASFYNTSPADAVEAIGSALRGEAEPIRKYGVLLDDATLRNEALRLGLIKTTKTALTPQQKVLAAQAAIYRQTKDAQGDFVRTSGGLANQQRILSAQFTDLKGKIGEGLLPVMVKLATVANDEIVPALSDFVDGMKSGEGAGGKFASTVGDVGDAAKTAWAAASPLFGFIADHPKLFTDLALGAGGLAVGLKGFSALKGVTGKIPGVGGAGALGGGVQKVFVVNMGAAGAVGPGGGGKVTSLVKTATVVGAAAAGLQYAGDKYGPKYLNNITGPLDSGMIPDGMRKEIQRRADLNAALLRQDKMDDPKFAAASASRGKQMSAVLKSNILPGTKAVGEGIQKNVLPPISRAGDAANRLLVNVLALPTSKTVTIDVVPRLQRTILPGGGLAGANNRDVDFRNVPPVNVTLKLDGRTLATVTDAAQSDRRGRGGRFGST